MLETHTSAKVTDIEQSLKEHGAKAILHNDHGDSIGFENEEDMTWFLLRFS